MCIRDSVWTECKSPAGSEGNAKVAQAAVLVQAVRQSQSSDELEDPLTALCELGREEGAVDALLQTKALEAATEAIISQESPPGACFLTADLCRLVSRVQPSAVPSTALKAVIAGLADAPDNRELFMATAMVCHNQLQGGAAQSVLECDAVSAITNGLQLLIEDPSAASYGVAVLSALVLSTDVAATAEQVAAASSALAMHTEDTSVLRQGLRFLTVAAMQGLSVPCADLVLSIIGKHSDDPSVCSASLSLLAMLPKPSFQLGHLQHASAALQCCASAEGSTAPHVVHGLILLSNILANRVDWSAPELTASTEVVLQGLHRWRDGEAAAPAMLCISRLSRHQAARELLVVEALPKIEAWLEGCDAAQVWGHTLQALMELSQDGAAASVAANGGIGVATAALVKYGAKYDGLTADCLLALWMMCGSETRAQSPDLWSKARKAASDAVAAYPAESHLEAALAKLEEEFA
eukprot:TRINITY_DN22357_c0_g1_i1.p1 TRINITY_DN22357_c0_g1~~TRINITY_DN22357_c0_g1_i1.p1  ORF type:complete len:467 (-),score=106.93 TRINITY_DN22357_c0_g1_i1:109-1509(-)